MFRSQALSVGRLGVLLGLMTLPAVAEAQAPRAAAPRGPATAVAPANGPPQVTPPRAPTAPFQLTVEQQQQLDAVLLAWRDRSDSVKTMRADFTKFEYNSWGGKDQLPPTAAPAAPVATRKCLGQIKYAAPDQGYVREHKVFTWIANGQDAAKGTFEPSEQQGAYWVCDGEAVFEFDAANKKLVEYRLPPEAQGQAIRQSPLPFLLGMDVDEMKERYWLREVTPPQSRQTQVWIEAYPKLRQDARNYRCVRVILTRQSMLPEALEMELPTAGEREVYVIQNVRLNDPLQQLLNFFAAPRAPIGWEHVVEEPPAASAPAQPPATTGSPSRPMNASAARPGASPRR
jgi:TIGR03009 family protein